MLWLTQGESGKSTVLKQIKMIHKINLTPQEIKDISRSLRKNAIECMIILVNQAKTFGYDLSGDDIKVQLFPDKIDFLSKAVANFKALL
jgi:uncharacterized protein YeeX (DUF496 family)